MECGADRSGVDASRRSLLFALLAAWPLGRQAGRGSPPPGADRVAEIEWHILFLTNQNRIWRRLAPLEPSPALADVARAHSRDMMARRFFGHVNPDGLSPRDRLARQGLKFKWVAENIYSTRKGTADAAEAAAIIVTGWMNSQGHRQNILDAAFKQIGVGAAVSDDEILATQLFVG
jgi:uncharacterized protein YkwD